MYITDTHPFVWYPLDRLPKNAHCIFRSAGKRDIIVYISMIVLTEHLAESGKIEIDFEGVSINFVPISFNFQVSNLSLDIKLKEIRKSGNCCMVV